MLSAEDPQLLWFRLVRISIQFENWHFQFWNTLEKLNSFFKKWDVWNEGQIRFLDFFNKSIHQVLKPSFMWSSEWPKPLFWFRSDTKMENLIGWYFRPIPYRYQNQQIPDVVVYLHG